MSCINKLFVSHYVVLKSIKNSNQWNCKKGEWDHLVIRKFVSVGTRNEKRNDV